jgi:adenylate kinase family enzyme
MKIANNILKHSLKNVYFLTGTPLAGKTTMAAAISEKYGFTLFNENWHDESFLTYRSIVEEKYQKHSFNKKEVTDWEAYFDRTTEEFLAERGEYGEYDEYIEYAIIELIKRSQCGKVIADVGVPVKLLAEISDYNRMACLLAAPGLVTCENYGKRESHKAFLDCLLSLKEPEKKIAVQDELFRISVEKTYEDVRLHHIFSLVRTDESTVENTLAMLEIHFNL